MKFRRLSSDELQHLEKEFVEFLVSNTITADDWVNIKETKQKEMNELIDLFSDIVFEKVFSKIDLLEKREPHNLLFFKFNQDSITTLGVSVKPDAGIDFNDPESFSGNLKKGVLTGFRTAKPLVNVDKSQEVFQLIQSGCVVGNPELYQTINDVVV